MWLSLNYNSKDISISTCSFLSHYALDLSFMLLYVATKTRLKKNSWFAVSWPTMWEGSGVGNSFFFQNIFCGKNMLDMAKTAVFQKQNFSGVCVCVCMCGVGVRKNKPIYFFMIGKRQHQFWPLCTLIILTIRR